MIQTWYLSNDFQMFIAVIPCALLFKWNVWAAVSKNHEFVLSLYLKHGNLYLKQGTLH